MTNFDAIAKGPRYAKPPKPEDFTERDDVPEKLDGRSARRTGRTVQFATVVSPEFRTWLKVKAAELGKSQAAVLDDMRVAYERQEASQ